MSLPFLLAGPILRRVEPGFVSVWVALSRACQVSVTVFPGPQTSTGPGTAAGVAVANGTAQTRPFGAHLHVALVTAKATTALAPGSLYSYDLVCDGKGLKELGLLKDVSSDADRPADVSASAPKHLAIGYELDRLPMFAMAAPTLADLRLVHTSCRKSNGSGPDALAWVDDEISDNQLDPVARPQQLFLTGDQIYADDLGACLLPLVSRVGIEALGFTEKLPVSGVDVEASETNLPALRRQRLTREIARFTSTEADNHLLTFGEYVAMYLLAFAPHAWSMLAEADDVFRAKPAGSDGWHLTDWEAAHGGVAQWRSAREAKGDPTNEERFAAERSRVEQWRDAVPKVARALANVPTYMICDDHEITDDWYISARWRSRVLTAPLGRTVIRNGLMAYTLCQSWGNDPQAYELQGQTSPPERDLLDALERYAADGAQTSTTTRDKLDDLLGLTSPTASPKVRFHYSVPGPLHLVRVLDTRTRRTYDGTGDGPPKLLGGTLDTQLPAGPFHDGHTLLVVVSAAPVLFPRFLDVLVQPVAAEVFDFAHHVSGKEKADPAKRGATILGAQEYDLESWHCVESAHETFLRRCGTYPRVVILSGDVHFASSMVLDFWAAGDDVADSRIIQFTSSAARNDPGRMKRAVIRSLRSGQALLMGVPYERLGWDSEPAITVPPGAHLRPGRRARLKRSPGAVPAAGWPAGTVVDPAKPPAYRWRLASLRDESANPLRPFEDTTAGLLPSLGADPIQGYAGVLGYHATLAAKTIDPLRLMVFRNNIGVISFAADGPDEVVVTHEILSPDGATSSDGGRFTTHTVSTARQALVPPQLRTV